MSEEVRRLMVAADCLVDERRDEVKHLRARRLRSDEVVDAVDLERLCDVGEHLVFPIALETIEQDAHIRPAEVEREIVAALRARRQSEIGRQHAQRGVGGAGEAEAHILTEVCRRLVQMLRIHRKRGDDFIVKHGIECHFYSSSCGAISPCASNTVCRRWTSTRVMRTPSTSST